MFTMLYNYNLCLDHHHFHYLKRKPVPIKHFLFTVALPQLLATTNLLSLWIYLSWIFHISKIIQYVTFCVWLLPQSILFSRLIHIVAFLFMTD